jgi:hypothetical protein
MSPVPMLVVNSGRYMVFGVAGRAPQEGGPGMPQAGGPGMPQAGGPE